MGRLFDKLVGPDRPGAAPAFMAAGRAMSQLGSGQPVDLSANMAAMQNQQAQQQQQQQMQQMIGQFKDQIGPEKWAAFMSAPPAIQQQVAGMLMGEMFKTPAKPNLEFHDGVWYDPKTGAVVSGDPAGPDMKDVDEFRKEFAGLQPVREFDKQRTAFGRIIASVQEPSAAGDLSLIFNYMKLLDPGSTVREGEFATAQNSAGVPDRVRAIFNSVLSGERLADGQRADFFGRSKMLYSEAEKGYTGIEQQYSDIAASRGYPSGSMIDFRYQGNVPDYQGNPPSVADVAPQSNDGGFTPEAIMQMGVDELLKLDPTSLSNEAASAVAARAQQLAAEISP